MPIDPTRREFLRAGGGGLLAAAAGIPLAPPDKQRPDLQVPKPGGKKIGWAIVGLGQLALTQVMPAFREAKLSRPVALVSGHRKPPPAYAVWTNRQRASRHLLDGESSATDDSHHTKGLGTLRPSTRRHEGDDGQ